jgi:hypothetical protein
VTHEAFYDTYDTYEFYDTYFFPFGFIEVSVPKYILYVDEYHIVKLLNWLNVSHVTPPVELNEIIQ